MHPGTPTKYLVEGSVTLHWPERPHALSHDTCQSLWPEPCHPSDTISSMHITSIGVQDILEGGGGAEQFLQKKTCAT